MRPLKHLLIGNRRARLDHLCRKPEGSLVFRRELTLRVERGRVVDLQEQTFSEKDCP